MWIRVTYFLGGPKFSPNLKAVPRNYRLAGVVMGSWGMWCRVANLWEKGLQLMK